MLLVISFPDGNDQGVMYEPWHWRYEGSADALRQFEAARRYSRPRP
jgi:D-alanyl-D-alanine carboxypeptidase